MLKKILNAPILLSLIVAPILIVGGCFVWNGIYEHKPEAITSDNEVIPQIDTSRDHEGDTFSVVAYDPVSGQIGGAATSCYGGHINFLNDIIRSPSGTLLGAIHTQAAYNSCNQDRVRTRMLAGDTPAQIISYIQANDCQGNNSTRQYGIVGIASNGSITTAGFTGSSNGNWAGHITGIDPNTGMHYAIQGNILDASTGGAGRQDILNDMESSFRNATGTLANKLMAALQGAKRVGGDSRCVNSGNSGLASFIRVLRPSDPIGTPYINLSVYPNISLVEPIDVLQCAYDTAVSTPFCRQTISTFPYSMDFETKSWEKETTTCSVNSSWIRSRFASPTGSTGPTAPNEGALYSFVESSNVGGQGTSPRSAILGSPCFVIPSNHTAQMTFDYHMYGANMGTLSVQASSNNGASWSTLWSLTGNQGNAWVNNVVVDLSSYSGSTVKLRLNALLGNGQLSDVAVDDIQITVQEIPACPGATKTWNGSTWSPTGAPGATNNVIINGNYNTSTNGNLTACTLTINSGRTLTISDNSYASIKGDITVNGTLFVANEGSLVQVDDAATVTKNGSITVRKITPFLAPRHFMVMGSPMTAETRTGVYGNAILVRHHLTANFNPDPAVAAFDPLAENFADEEGDNWVFHTGTVNAGEGYLVLPQPTLAASGSYTLDYTLGTLNNGQVDFNVLYNGNQNASPNIVGNPYASAIDADLFMDDADNSMINAVYFWEHLTAANSSYPGYKVNNFDMGDISIYNGSGGLPAANDPGTSTTPNGYISSGQGFGFKATAPGTAKFKNYMRVTDNNDTYRRPGAPRERMWLNVANETYGLKSTMLISFSEESIDGYDTKYDAKRLATPVSLYSKLESGEELAIQGRSAFNADQEVPLGFVSQIEENQEFKISISEQDGTVWPDVQVYLLDKSENVVHNLTDADYIFKSKEGVHNDRFVLLFKRTVLGTVENQLQLISIAPNPTTGKVTVVSPKAVINSVEVFDIRGRKLKSVKIINSKNYSIDLTEMQNAVYFVKISTDMGSVTKQIIKQ